MRKKIVRSEVCYWSEQIGPTTYKLSTGNSYAILESVDNFIHRYKVVEQHGKDTILSLPVGTLLEFPEALYVDVPIYLWEAREE